MKRAASDAMSRPFLPRIVAISRLRDVKPHVQSPNFDLPELSIGILPGNITDAVGPAQVSPDLLIHSCEVFHGSREKRPAPGHLRELLHFRGAGRCCVVTDEIEGNVNLSNSFEREFQCAALPGVLTIAEDDDTSPTLFRPNVSCRPGNGSVKICTAAVRQKAHRLSLSASCAAPVGRHFDTTIKRGDCNSIMDAQDFHEPVESA